MTVVQPLPPKFSRPMKEYEVGRLGTPEGVHGSPQQDENKSLDEVFREAAREGSLYE